MYDQETQYTEAILKKLYTCTDDGKVTWTDLGSPWAYKCVLGGHTIRIYRTVLENREVEYRVTLDHVLEIRHTDMQKLFKMVSSKQASKPAPTILSDIRTAINAL